MDRRKIIILGAGLSGLTIGYHLKKQGIDFQILEAREKMGGRIRTIFGNNKTPIEMGATWFGNKHQHFVAFLKEIGIDIFQQYNHGISFFETMSFAPPQKFEIPKNAEPTFRIQGGTQQVIYKLGKEVGEENILLNTVISKIKKQDTHVSVETEDGKIFTADLIISTIPPKLFVQNISCTPALPNSTLNVFQNTQIWMENSIKFGVEYATPFWKAKGFSGSIFSQSSIIPEMYDHSNFEENKFALKGFLNGAVANFSKAERENAVIKTLVKFLGEDAENHIGYFDNLWENEKFTFSTSPQFLGSHYNNGHPVFQKGYWENQLWFAGTETSTQFGGYMEGAIQSAERVVQQVLNI